MILFFLSHILYLIITELNKSEDIKYREAIRILVDKYESENVGLLNPSNEV